MARSLPGYAGERAAATRQTHRGPGDVARPFFDPTVTHLYIATRGPSGAFAPATALALPMSCDAGEVGPAIDPTQTPLWFTCKRTGIPDELLEGRPP